MLQNLKFRTFDSLLASVVDDLDGYDLDSAFNITSMIKVVLKINKELGLKLHKEYETIIEIKNNKAVLPDNFQIMNAAFICSSYTHTGVANSLTSENFVVDTCKSTVQKPFQEPCATEEIECCYKYKVVRQRELYEYTVNRIIPIRVNNSMRDYIKNDYDLIIKDGYVVTNFEKGEVIINYLGTLEDEEGNLLVLDHPMINEYYEYSLKKKLFESLYLNGDEAVLQKLQFIQMEVDKAKIVAFGIVNTPEISDIMKAFDYNRHKIINKYFNPIQKTNNFYSIPLNRFIP